MNLIQWQAMAQSKGYSSSAITTSGKLQREVSLSPHTGESKWIYSIQKKSRSEEHEKDRSA